MTSKTKHSKPRVLSGMRPTGKLHLGNYVGALANWVKLQDTHDCFFFIADWHALTTDYADTSEVKQNSLEVVIDWLAAGLDPERSTLFVQSHILEHSELHLLLSMITPLGWLERVPTYKEQQQNLKTKDLATYGFLGYPVLQSADILLYRASAALPLEERKIQVPVGDDQVAHVELTREIARRFNQYYRWRRPDEHTFPAAVRRYAIQYGVEKAESDPHAIFPEPEVLLTKTARLRGSDGRKMSKSYENAIFLGDEPDTVARKLNTFITVRTERQEPGIPENCPVGDVVNEFCGQEHADWTFKNCRSAGISCTECKKEAAERLNQWLIPVRERRKKYTRDPGELWAVLQRGTERATAVARATMGEVRHAMGMSHSQETLLDLFPYGTEFKSFLFLPFDETQSIPSPQQRGEKRRAKWLKFAPKDISLRPTDVPRVFVTPRNKRVCIVSSAEFEGKDFLFLPRDKTYEVLVLLFHLRSGKIVDLIVPGKLILPHWKKFEREEKNVRIKVRLEDDHFTLLGPHGLEIPLDDFRANYELLK